MTYIYAEAEPRETIDQTVSARYTVHALDEYFTHVSTLSVPKVELAGVLAAYKGHVVKTCCKPGDLTVLNMLHENKPSGSLQLCNPFLFSAEELTSGKALYLMRHLNMESPLGGWQHLNAVDRRLMQSEPESGRPHPLLTWLRAFSPGLPVSLLYQFTKLIGHPWWFVSAADPTGGVGVSDYLRLGHSKDTPRREASAEAASKFIKTFENYYMQNTGDADPLFSDIETSSARTMAKLAANKFCMVVSACWLDISFGFRYGWPVGTFYRPEDYFNKDSLERYFKNLAQQPAAGEKPG